MRYNGFVFLRCSRPFTSYMSLEQKRLVTEPPVVR